MPEPLFRDVHAALWKLERDALLEGPVGTGKSYAAAWWLHSEMERHPNARALVCRKNRVDMTESTLVTLEDEVMGPGHPAITGTASRSHRRRYTYPNGAGIVVAGMNHPTAVLSAQYDRALLEEAKEFSREDYELISGRMRNSINSGAGQERIVLVTNPGPSWHWLNLMGAAGQLERLRSRHWHNPAFYDTATREWTPAGKRYLGRIRDSFSGERYAQYVEGQWADASGRVFPMYDPATHVIDARIERDGPRIFLRRTLLDGTLWKREIQWTAAGVDWGFAVPGTAQVWGWDKENVAYLLAEVYQSRRDPVWWTEQLLALHREFGLRRIICDSAEPDRIYMLNSYLGELGKGEQDRIAIRCEKGRDANLAHLQALLLPSHTTPTNLSGSKLYLLQDTLRAGRDVDHDSKGLPCCLSDELVQLQYDENAQDKPLRDRIDPTLHNHAADAAMYIMRWAYQRDLTVAPEKRPVVPGSFADVLGHRAKLEAVAAIRSL